MTVTKRKSTPLSEILAPLKKEERRSVLEKLIEIPGFSTSGDQVLDEVFQITGTAQRLSTAVEKMDKIGNALPIALSTVWTEHKEAAANDQVNLLAEMDRSHQTFLREATEKMDSIGKLARNAEKRNRPQGQKASLVYVMAGIGIGMVSMGLLCYFVAIPKQVELVRAADAPILDWLSSIDGRLMKKSFSSGNRSVKDCIRRSAVNNSKKVVCQIELK